MYSSGSDNTSWEFIPPKKLQTTLLIDSSFMQEEISESRNKTEKPYSRYPLIATPRDNTRANSPIQVNSNLFSDDEDSEGLRTLYEQLVLVRDRHATLQTYVNSIRAQLQQSFNLAIAELQGKRNSLISQIDLLYDQAFGKLCLTHKEKEIRIQIKSQELENCLEDVENVIQKIEMGIDKIPKEIENTLKI